LVTANEKTTLPMSLASKIEQIFMRISINNRLLGLARSSTGCDF